MRFSCTLLTIALAVGTFAAPLVEERKVSDTIRFVIITSMNSI
jgi:hypothetical protein